MLFSLNISVKSYMQQNQQGIDAVQLTVVPKGSPVFPVPGNLPTVN